MGVRIQTAKLNPVFAGALRLDTSCPAVLRKKTARKKKTEGGQRNSRSRDSRKQYLEKEEEVPKDRQAERMWPICAHTHLSRYWRRQTCITYQTVPTGSRGGGQRREDNAERVLRSDKEHHWKVLRA